jgi:hypothetical protein
MCEFEKVRSSARFSFVIHWPKPSFWDFELLHKINDPDHPAKRLPAMPAGAVLLTPRWRLVRNGFDDLSADLRWLVLDLRLKVGSQEGFFA